MDTKALRQKILDLAVRGKLVPQNPDDEPARVLLERIGAEKKQMVKDGRLKAKDIKNDSVIYFKEDNLPYEQFPDGTEKCITDEIPFELPHGWEWTRLVSICDKIIDGDHNPPKGENVPTKYLMLSSTNINNNSITELNKVRYLSKEIFEKENTRTSVKIGDIFFTSVGSLGRSCVYQGGYNICFQRSVSVISTLILNYYLKYYFDCSFIQEKISREATGTAQKGFYLNQLSFCLIAVPPLSEQKRIAEKINELMGLVDVIEQNKTDLQTAVKLAKEKILDLAIRGQLVPQNPDDEPASVLLERIRAEKQQLIQQGKIKPDKKDTVTFTDDELPFELPDGWEWARLQNISEIVTGSTPSKKKLEFYGGDFPFYKPTDLEQGENVVYASEYLSDLGKSVSRLIPKGSTAVCCIGSIGKSGYIGKEGTTNQQINSIIPMIENKYVYYYSCSKFFVDELLSTASATTIAIVNKGKMSNILIPIPPLHEQKRIADKINQLFSMLDSITEFLN